MNETERIIMPSKLPTASTVAFSTDASKFAVKETLPHKTIILITLYVVIFILGVAGNTSVVTFFARKTKRTLYDTYIIHLAFADLLVSLIAPPRAIFTIIIHDDGAYFNLAGCRALSAVEPISVNASSWILTSIALERYRGIVQPLKPRYRRCYIHTAVMVIWLTSFLCFIPYIRSINVVGKHCLPQWDSVVEQLAFNAVVLTVQSVVPMLIMSYTLLSICQAMRKRRKANLGRPLRSLTKEANLIIVLLVAFLVFILCTLPYNIFYLMTIYDIGVMRRYEKLAKYINWNDWLSTMVLVSSVTNCCIYAGLHKEFKKFCRQCIQRRKATRKKASSKFLLTLLSEKTRKSSNNNTTNHARNG